jgi:hypothetical protein
MHEVVARLTPALQNRYRIDRELGAGGMPRPIARDLGTIKTS